MCIIHPVRQDGEIYGCGFLLLSDRPRRQSIAKAAVLKRYKQQILVTTRCFEAHRLLEIKK